MQSTVELPDSIFRQLETMAREEGATTTDLIRRLIEAHVSSRRPVATDLGEVRVPLIPASDTGPIQPISGKDLDELLSRDDFAA